MCGVVVLASLMSTYSVLPVSSRKGYMNNTAVEIQSPHNIHFDLAKSGRVEEATSRD